MRFLMGLSIFALGISVANADLLSYHFDSNNEGWRRGDLDVNHLTVTDVGAATWNSGGYIDAPDFANWSFHLSPLIQQNFSSASRIEFDYSSQFSDNVYPFLIINSSSGAIYQMAAVPADSLFHHYSYDFTPGTWQFVNSTSSRVATATDISSVLADFVQFGINADQESGPDYTRLDNVVVVPEPTSLVGIGMGILVLIRGRRQKIGNQV